MGEKLGKQQRPKCQAAKKTAKQTNTRLAQGEAAAGPQGAQLEKYEFVKIKIGSRSVGESPVTKYEFVKLGHN